MRKFSRRLTSKQLMQVDILGDVESDFRDKVAQCFEWRCQKMEKRQQSDNARWMKVLNNEKNYIMCKHGYKEMLRDLEKAKKNISKFKRGLSVFDESNLREQLLSSTNAPVISINNLRDNL